MKWRKIELVVLGVIITVIMAACSPAPLIIEVYDDAEAELPTEVAAPSEQQAEAAAPGEQAGEEAAPAEQAEAPAAEEAGEAAAPAEEQAEAAAPGEQAEGFTLTILHNNDGESQLINAGGDNTDFGGVARFATLVDNLRTEAVDGSGNNGVVMLSSGDNFLASPEFKASLEKGAPFYDTMAIDMIGYDAMAIGNHEFDFGPEVLADFIEGFEGRLSFVSANLDFSQIPRLQALVDQGVIVKSLVIEEEGQQIGVVGATTPQISFISSPGNVAVNPDVAGTIQAEVDALEANGVNKIIIISHLQSVNEDLDLAGQLSGVDVMIAGGGDELLANEGDLLVPGDEEPFGPYPLIATGADGAEIPVVTTAGDYKYVGRLIVTFDADGKINSVDEASGLVRVAGGANPDAVEPDPEVQAAVVGPIETYLADLANTVIATSEVALEGRRSPGVRTIETNEGNLMADALRWQATQLAEEFGANPPDVGIQNGGGIRNNALIESDSITELDTFNIAPFANYVAIVEDIPPDQFKEIMENAVSQVEDAGGRFAQISGFKMVYDISGTPQELDEAGNVVTPGTRVQQITLDDGTVIVQDGAVVDGAPSVNVATIDFLAQGGDQYPFRGAPFTLLGVSYQQALSNYITEALGGVISAEQYPEGGEGRIIELEGGEVAAAEAGAAAPAEAGEAAGAAEGEAMAATDMCAQDYTVQVDDWLSKISERFLSNMFAYPLIFQATNAAATVGGPYATLTDPDVIEVGQVLCIPSSDGEAMMEGETVIDVAAADGRFSALINALETAGLDETLRGKGPFTIFAPTDDAFAALPEGQLDRMLADIPTLTSMLLCHVVMGKFTAADLAALSAIDTIGGQHITFTSTDDTIQVNEARITTADLEAANGIIHIIDTVILPPGISQ